MNTKPADQMTDDDLAQAVETLAAFAREYLPEGYVVRLDCSQHGDGIQLIWFEDGDGPGESVPLEGKEGWGHACDAANADIARRVRDAVERGEL